jgi:type IV secretory pathway TraG/TraD family ATPase VirD4
VGAMLDRWTPQTPLVSLSPHDVWTLRDAYEGSQIFGATGSGKTSGSGAAIARAFLREGFGGLVCCAKPEERETWEGYAEETGRTDDLRIFSPGGAHRFNFLRYELERAGPGGGQTENLVNLLSVVTEIAEGGSAHGGDRDRYWERAARQMLRNAIDALALAGEALTLDNLMDLIAEAPKNAAQVEDKQWQESSYLHQTLEKARRRVATLRAREVHDLQTAIRYWLKQFAELDERPRSSIVSTFTSTADMLAHGLAWELMATDVTLIPEVTYAGKIIILDLPLQEYGEVGRVIQGIWKTMFQRAVLRRKVKEHPRPVFLWCDEAQNFISSFDFEYQATARSARACTVFMVQNLPSYRAKLGVGAHDAALALLGNFQTKIWHANGDHVTNIYAADTIGQRIIRLSNEGANVGEHGASASSGSSEQLHHVIPPHYFARLRKGGVENHREVEAVIFQGGKVWNATGDTYLPVTFMQPEQ